MMSPGMVIMGSELVGTVGLGMGATVERKDGMTEVEK